MDLDYNLLLGSKSPRRKSLISGLEMEVKVVEIACNEIYPADLNASFVPVYLSELKSAAFTALQQDELLITADTVVILGNQVLGKPKDREEAKNMLRLLSDNSHHVVTGVCLRTTNKTVSFTEETEVVFHALTDNEIEHYVDTYKPYDKAGSYGIQEWIGYVGVKEIRGCYYNVMGLPLSSLYRQLNVF